MIKMNLDNKKIEKLGRTVLHIPARKGSKRVPNKNMRMLNGKPMIGYTFDLARNLMMYLKYLQIQIRMRFLNMHHQWM